RQRTAGTGQRGQHLPDVRQMLTTLTRAGSAAGVLEPVPAAEVPADARSAGPEPAAEVKPVGTG
ncbi:hypothetical protein, partial [Jatrophihabitans sp.]|uniref:hypothetical protein n=1 Tax=Jatrophihabitans sp. TaxID=1932789 RepID=UPI002C3E709F|nr:hypothetical protein [Jatrophihabitans sp.]